MAGSSVPADVVRRLGVFVDQAFVYEAARATFASAERPPAYFGNVHPAEIAQFVRHRPPPWEPRSARRVVQVSAVVPHFDPAQRPVMQARVERWRRDDVDVRLSPSLPGPMWRTARAVLVAMLVTRAIEQGQCDVAVIVAGDPGLLPLVADLVREDRDQSRVELVTWVSDNGASANRLAAEIPTAWCHRLGRKTFELLAERPAPAPRPRRPARPPDTAISHAFEVAQHRHQAASPEPPEGGASVDPAGEVETPPRRLRWWKRGRRPPENG